MTLTEREKNAYGHVVALILLGFILALDPIMPGGSFWIWDGTIQVAVNGYWVRGVGQSEPINYQAPGNWPTPVGTLTLPLLLLLLTFILPILIASILLAFIVLGLNRGDWKAIALNPPPWLKVYTWIVWCGCVIMLSLDAASVAESKGEVRLTPLGYATLITGFILVALQLVMAYRAQRSGSGGLLPCYSAPATSSSSRNGQSSRSRGGGSSSDRYRSSSKKPKTWMDSLLGK